MKIEELASKLEDRRISVVAERTGIAEATLRAIARGANKNPTYANYMRLVEYFNSEEK